MNRIVAVGGRLGIGPVAARWLAAAAGAWTGAGLATAGLIPVGFGLGVGVGMLALRWGTTTPWLRWVAVPLLVACMTGSYQQVREEARFSVPLPQGTADIVGRVLTDPVAFRGRETVVVRPRFVDGAPFDGPDLAIEWPEGRYRVEAGQWLRAQGSLGGRDRRLRGRRVAATMRSRSLEVVDPAEPWLSIGNGLRAAVRARLPPTDGPRAALLRGFLIGDTTGLGAFDTEALRRAGLTHFVAVSGSNVALFLGMWFLAMAPFARSARGRALAGIPALGVFVVMTRWEPSVVRAAVMAALVLVARAFGVALDGWSVLGAAVAGLLIVGPGFASSVGFQLSVAATAGVMAGVRAGAAPSRGRLGTAVGRVLRPTVGAQVAVVPILLAHFGTVPLLAPLANLAAAPLVSAATTLGVVGVVVGGPVLGSATWAAGLVIGIARLASGWPQLDVTGVAVASLAVLAGRIRGRRWVMGFGVAATVVWMATSVGPSVPRPAVAFLDVGQGDAALVMGSEATILVDGGPDPARLVRKLARFDVDRLDLVIVSHPHADHVSGLSGVAGRIPIGMVWYGSAPHTTDAWDRVATELAAVGIPVVDPGRGSFRVGDLELDVVGPRRRYASPNDQSLVVQVSLAGMRVLFAGDTEAVAQRELGWIPTDVLKVPHQGAATSDREWLAAEAPSLAVIPVGPNSYGHPAPWVIEVLQGAGSRVVRTDQAGDVVVTPGDISATIRSTSVASSG